MTTQEALTYFKHRIECGQCGKETTQMSAFEEAIKALEKQIQKKPIDDEIYRYCPVCSREVGFIDILAEEKLKYCYECGQAIDWSEE